MATPTGGTPTLRTVATTRRVHAAAGLRVEGAGPTARGSARKQRRPPDWY